MKYEVGKKYILRVHGSYYKQYPKTFIDYFKEETRVFKLIRHYDNTRCCYDIEYQHKDSSLNVMMYNVNLKHFHVRHEDWVSYNERNRICID